MNSVKKYGILIVGHGSRNARANSEFEEFVNGYALHRPDVEIRFANIEFEVPDLKTALRDFAVSCRDIIVVPLFLFASGHVKNDIPLAISEINREHPEVNILTTECIGINAKIIQLLHDRAYSALPQVNGEQAKTGVIMVSRGSSDVDANSDFYKAARIFEEGNHYSFVMPGFAGITRPSLGECLEMAARLRPEKLLVLPYFLFGGRLIVRIGHTVAEFAEKYPWIKTGLASFFGPDPALFSVIDDLIENTLTGQKTGSCTTCEYRVQLPGLASKVGGLKALLWSVRHMETHTQAGPHEFPHRNLVKHVLVCGNVDCAGKGSVLLISRLRQLLKKTGRYRDFRISKTSCMGRCGEGPVVVVYPDGIWYQKVSEKDAEDIVHQHLLGDRIVSRLVDNIMQ